MVLMIASHQRAGSSNLGRFLRRACGIELPLEPLNWRALTQSAPGWRDDERLLAQQVDATLSRVDAFKHIYGQHAGDFDRSLFAHPRVSRIVTLSRRDVNAAALSAVIAKKKRDFNSGADGSLGRIDPAAIVMMADELRTKAQKAQAAASASGKPLMEVTYEDIFSPDIDTRQARLRALLDFSGFRAPRFESAFDLYMTPDKKTNRAANYRQIENWSEIAALVPGIAYNS